MKNLLKLHENLVIFPLKFSQDFHGFWFHSDSRSGEKYSTTSRVFPYTSLVFYRFLRALQQNTVQSRLLYLLNGNFPSSTLFWTLTFWQFAHSNTYLIIQSLQHLHVWPQVACSSGSWSTKQQMTRLSLFLKNSIAAELNPRMVEAPFLLESLV